MGSIINTQSAGRYGAREKSCWSFIESYNSAALNDSCCSLASIHTAKSKSCLDGRMECNFKRHTWVTSLSCRHRAAAASATQLCSGPKLLCWKDIHWLSTDNSCLQVKPSRIQKTMSGQLSKRITQLRQLHCQVCLPVCKTWEWCYCIGIAGASADAVSTEHTKDLKCRSIARGSW